jgi:surface protein
MELGSSDQHGLYGRGCCAVFLRRVTYLHVGGNFQFYDALEFNQNLGEWDVSSVTDMRFMVRNSVRFLLPTN